MKPEDSAGRVDGLATDLRLIPEFDGALHAVGEWLEKLELVCRLRGITELHTVVPLRLTAGAFSVYQQLNSADKNDFSKIKAALISAFAADKFVAYEQFVTRRLQDGESVDVYLAELRRLAALFGGIPDNGLICAFVAGLPSSVSHILRAGSRLEDLDITRVLSRARAVLVERVAGAGTTTPLDGSGRSHRTTPASISVVCHVCNQPNHYARDCLAGRGGRRGSRSNVRCFSCRQLGHIASSCPGNGSGEVALGASFLSGLSVTSALPTVRLFVME
ncbi:hypothetical protein GWK47_050258 [Chionoecetes opilio]|uniref:CCHC-type domain-containing protein n=1 Tax=Chionoecetes opilio TaxID=41210 RepID=A0A8J5CEF8_CHIOP|nr:hypothetical protein GWK47_050258 [Chionoecetes opilio]